MSLARRVARKAKKRAKKAAKGALSPDVIADTARHEAAHAVVSVLLGLPLASTDIKNRIVTPTGGGGHAMPSLKKGQVGISTGYTVLVEGTVDRWQEALPDEAAQKKLCLLAEQLAAGIVATLAYGGASNDPAHRDDHYQMVQIAGALGIGNRSDEPAVKEFLKACYARAQELLLVEDDGTVWDRVTEALLDRRELSGDDVREIVGVVGPQYD